MKVRSSRRSADRSSRPARTAAPPQHVRSRRPRTATPPTKRTIVIRPLLILPLAGFLAQPAVQDGSCSSSVATTCGATAPAARLVNDDVSIVGVAQSTGQHETLVKAAIAAGFAEMLDQQGPYTVFAPTDAAFAKLGDETLASLLKPENKSTLQAILSYHVVPGTVKAEQAVRVPSAMTLNGQNLSIDVTDGQVRIDGATVTAADVGAKNGVVHVIDTVLIPNDKDIVETALADGRFGTLATALTTAGLVETLQGEGPFTVFAPTDAAFAKLGDTVTALLAPEKRADLTLVLTYHVVPGRVLAGQAVAAQSAETVQGAALRFAIRDGQLFVNGARVVGTDIETTNGVIHVIEDVLLP